MKWGWSRAVHAQDLDNLFASAVERSKDRAEVRLFVSSCIVASQPNLLQIVPFGESDLELPHAILKSVDIFAQDRHHFTGALLYPCLREGKGVTRFLPQYVPNTDVVRWIFI